MPYPKTVYDIATLAQQSAEALTAEGVDAALFNDASKIPAIVHTFQALKEKTETISGDVLRVFAGCAYLCFKEGFGDLRQEAEPLHYATHNTLVSE